MMKRQGLLIVSFVFLTVGLVGCLGDGGYKETFGEVPSVISMDSYTGSLLIDNYVGFGSVYAPELNNRADISVGDCGFSYFTIDEDSQVKGSSYYTATSVTWVPVGQTEVFPYSGVMPNLGKDTMAVCSIYPPDSYGRVTLLRNKMFLTCSHDNIPNDRKYIYRLAWKTDMTAAIDSMFLVAEATNDGTASTIGNYRIPCAIDMSAFTYSTATKDTMINDIKCRIGRTNLMYQTGFDKDKKPVFKPHSINPLIIISPVIEE